MRPEIEFEQVVRDHQTMVFRTLLRLTGTREHLDDLAQEVFLRFYRAMAGFRGEAQISTYLYRIAVNVARDAGKRRGRERRETVSISDEETRWEDRLTHSGPNAEAQMQDREFQAVVDERLTHLSQMERAVLVLYYQEEQSYEQIAAALDLPIGTVRTHLHRGRKKLRESLETWRAAEGSRRCEKIL